MTNVSMDFEDGEVVQLDGVLVSATDRRMHKAIRKVWESIPPKDRAAISPRLIGIYSHPALKAWAAEGLAEETAIFIRPVSSRSFSPKEIEHLYTVIAHELAHFLHGHKSTTAREQLRNEIEADATAERWGYRSIGAISFAIARRDAILQNKPASEAPRVATTVTEDDVDRAQELVEWMQRQM